MNLKVHRKQAQVMMDIHAKTYSRAYHPLYDTLIQTCEKRGFTISIPYASDALWKEGGKLVPAFEAVKKDLDDSTYILLLHMTCH